MQNTRVNSSVTLLSTDTNSSSTRIKVEAEGFMREKLVNMIRWLQGLAPMKKNPGLPDQLGQYANPEGFRTFKAWFKTTVRPQLKVDPNNNTANVEENADVFVRDLLLSYSLLPSDFAKMDLVKFRSYILMFEELIK